MAFDLKEIVASRLGENYELHERYINRTLVAAQRVIGFDKVYARAEGAYLYDMDNQPYLDFLSGYSVFNIGRNHPLVKQAIHDVLGSLSLMGCESFTEGFGPLMEGFDTRVPLDDIEALERQLRSRDVAAFVIETVQGKGCQTSKTDFFPRAQELCRKYGTLLISDEVQTGLGRTGKMFGFQHWNLEPDIITLAKTLSGGYVPCGAILTRREIYQKTFSRMDRCVVHSTTFGRNNLAMACGLASLEVIDQENLVEHSAKMGALLMERIQGLKAKHSFIKEVRGKGLMVGIEFHEPNEFKLRMAWKLLHKIDSVLFAQMIVTQMLSKHRILTQVAGHGMDVLKILPPLIIGEKEVDMFVNALDDVLTECRKFPGPMWELGNNFVKAALGSRRSTEPRPVSA